MQVYLENKSLSTTSKFYSCPRSFPSRPTVHFSDNLSALGIILRYTSKPEKAYLFYNPPNKAKLKKKPHVSRRRPLHILGLPLFFYYFFMSKNQQASLLPMYLVLLCLIQRKLKIERWRLSASLFKLRLKY